MAVALGHFDSARRRFRLAEKNAASGGLGPIAMAQAWNGAGIVAKYRHRYQSAEARYLRALHAISGRARAGNMLRASLFHNLAGLEHARGRFESAETWARRGLVLRRRLPFASARAVAGDQAGLAAILHAQGRLAEASGLYRLSIASLRRELGKQHFEVGFNLSQLAALEGQAGRLVRSERLFAQALRVLKPALPARHPILLQVLANRARLRERRRHRTPV